MLYSPRLTGFGAGGGAILPTDLANLVAWYRADLGITYTGDPSVSGWADQSGNGNNLTSSSPNMPTFVSGGGPNSTPMIQFDGSNDRLRDTFTLIAQPYHVFMVFMQDTWTGNEDILGTNTGGGGVEQDSSTPQIAHFAGSPETNHISPTLGTWYLFQSLFNGTNSFQTLNINAATSGGNPGTNGINVITVAGNANGTGEADINVAELAIYSAQITGGDETNLRNYFNARYELW